MEVKVFISLANFSYVNANPKIFQQREEYSKRIFHSMNRIFFGEQIDFKEVEAVFFNDGSIDIEMIRDFLKLIAYLAFPTKRELSFCRLMNKGTVGELFREKIRNVDCLDREYKNVLVNFLSPYILINDNERWLYFDGKFFDELIILIPRFLEQILTIINLKNEKETIYLNDIRNIIKSQNASKGGTKKAQNINEFMQPIRDIAIKTYVNPRQANRNKWKSRNEFTQYFCMHYNKNILDEKKWIKESTVKKWIKEYLEN